MDAGSPNSQRAYRAACPGCGAPVEFRSAQSTHAVCSYCQSTVVRAGDVLERVGKMAELFDDFSPLQLQTSGVFQARKFTLAGRLQYRYGRGTWTEWYAVFDDDAVAGGEASTGLTTGFLSEDNGAYVFSLPASVKRNVPPADRMRVGASTVFDGKPFTVASVETVSLASAQGELPRLPALGMPTAMVELRSADGEVLSIDYGAAAAGAAPALSRGHAVLLDDLQLAFLREASAKDEKGQQFDCPNCGAQVSVTLANSKSITCKSCKSIIDLSNGIGADLQHAMQDEPVKLLIALGSSGLLQGTDWQVVGFQHRLGVAFGDDNLDDEAFRWSEYLLYNRNRGFTFLVDAEDGWSLVKPATGAPVFRKGAQSTNYLGARYVLRGMYHAQTTYVAGEFYWQVKRGEKSTNSDFSYGSSLLSREITPTEATWSIGNKIDGTLVAEAFKLGGKKALFKRLDARPTSAASSMSVAVIVLVLLVIVIVVSRCTPCNPNVESCSSSSSSRTAGGSFGGSTGGGGHK